MIRLHVRRATLAALASAALLAGFARPTSAAVITKEFGSGDDVTRLLLQFAGTVDSVLYTYRFTFNAETPLTGADLFLALDAADPQLTLTFSGSASANFYLTDVSYDGYSEPTFEEEGNFYWTYFVSGGKEQQIGGPPNYEPIPGQFDPVPSGAWNSASAGASNRVVEPGSWDAWVFGEYDAEFNYIGALPSVAPVPEPGVVGLLALGGGLIIGLARRRHA